MILNQLNSQWVISFQSEYGRKPRILHIGNIANNGYNNAKLMNQAGLDCDVLCADYYHIMGCPEWEDADFSQPVKDDFRPNWAELDLTSFQRPTWFAQGLRETCIDYLIAKREHSKKASQLWRLLLADSLVINKSSLIGLTNGLNVVRNVIDIASMQFKKIRRFACKVILDTPLSSSRVVFHQITWRFQFTSELIFLLLSIAFMFVLVARLLLGTLYRLLRPVYIILRNVILYRHLKLTNAQLLLDDARKAERLQLVSRIANEWSLSFYDRTDKITESDIEPYLYILPKVKLLLKKYDFVIGYATDPIYPLLCDVPYFAFEHGTIREIPYKQDSQGRLTALAYRKADHVFVTNFDCINSAKYLAPGRFTAINHPFDEDHGDVIEDTAQRRQQLLDELDADFIFFHPTRQDWVQGTGYADKANDIFIRAFCRLRNEGFRVGLILCKWGKNIEQTTALIDQHNCGNYVKWVSPLAIIEFERMCKASDIVVDQFKLGAFGGVLFKAMSVGSPILTYLNETQIKDHYPVTPPVINCQTTEEIVSEIHKVISDKELLSSIGKQGRAWIKTYHSKQQTINAQVDQFRQKLPFTKMNH